MTPDLVSRFRTACLVVLMAGVCLHAQESQPSRSGVGLHEGFFQSQGAHFTILFDGPQDYALASRALEVLEEAYYRIGTALYTFPDHPITVILYTQQQFQDVTRAPAWAAGAYDGRIRIPIRGALDRPEELTRVLSHELTHAMVQAIAPHGVPTWLNEGLAVNFEPGGAAWADGELAATTDRLPLSTLAGDFTGKSADEARIAYAESAVVARRLLEEGGGSAVVAILEDLSRGLTFRAAVEQRLFIPYDLFAGSDAGSR